MTKAQRRALAWLANHGPAALDPYGRAISRIDGHRASFAPQTFLRLFISGHVGADRSAARITLTRKGMIELVKSANS